MTARAKVENHSLNRGVTKAGQVGFGSSSAKDVARPSTYRRGPTVTKAPKNVGRHRNMRKATAVVRRNAAIASAMRREREERKRKAAERHLNATSVRRARLARNAAATRGAAAAALAERSRKAAAAAIDARRRATARAEHEEWQRNVQAAARAARRKSLAWRRAKHKQDIVVSREESWRTRTAEVQDMVESRNDFADAVANYAAGRACAEQCELMFAKDDIASQKAVVAVRKDNEAVYDAEVRREHSEWVETVQVALEAKTFEDMSLGHQKLESAQLGTKVAAVSTHFFPEGDTGL